MSVLLLILKIIGIIILSVISLALILILLVLFVPVRYKGELKYGIDEEEMNAFAVVSWLCSIIRGKVSYNKKDGLYYNLRIFGIKLKSSDKEKPEKKDKQSDKTKPKDNNKTEYKGESVTIKELSDTTSGLYTIEETKEYNVEDDVEDSVEESIEESIEYKTDDKTENKTEDIIEDKSEAQFEPVNQIGVEAKAGKKRFITRIKEGIHALIKLTKSIFDGAVSLVDKITAFIDHISKEYDFYKRFLADERNKLAFNKCLNKLLRILKCLRPRVIKGRICFGFDDPSQTGQILAFLSIMYPNLPPKLIIDSRFDEKILNADIYFRGKIEIYVLVFSAISIYFDKNVKRLLRIYKRHKNKGNK